MSDEVGDCSRAHPVENKMPRVEEFTLSSSFRVGHVALLLSVVDPSEGLCVLCPVPSVTVLATERPVLTEHVRVVSDDVLQ
jgi:hypothetical protein